MVVFTKKCWKPTKKKALFASRVAIVFTQNVVSNCTTIQFRLSINFTKNIKNHVNSLFPLLSTIISFSGFVLFKVKNFCSSVLHLLRLPKMQNYFAKSNARFNCVLCTSDIFETKTSL